MPVAQPWLTTFEPMEELRHALACSWNATPSGDHRLTPDGCPDLLRISDGTFVLCGTEHRSWTFRLPPDVTAVGVRFRPGVASVLFDIDMSAITDRRVPLADIVGDDEAQRVGDIVGAAADLDAQRHALVAAVAGWATDLVVDPVACAVLEVLARSPHARQSELANAAAVSTRSLRRLALRRFGYGTATLSRLLRFQRFLAAAVLAVDTPSIAVLAARADYVDQAHLNRDCRAITTLSPAAFLTEYFPTFPNMADPYKTTESTWRMLVR